MTTATKTNTKIPFDQVMKLFKKFTAKGEIRPVLNYVHYDGKYLVATNSHVLLRVNAEHVSGFHEELTETFLYDPVNMELIGTKLNYPETNRLIPDYYNSTLTIDGNIKDLHKHIKAAKKEAKKDKNKKIRFEFLRNETKIIVNNFESWTTGIENKYYATMNNLTVQGEELYINLNGQYMDDILTTIKKLSNLSNDTITMGILSNNRPVHFKQENIFDIVVMPVRNV